MVGQKIGFKHTKETKRKISNCSKEFWKNPEYVKKVIESREKTRRERGYINSPEAREKSSEAMKKRFLEGKFNPKDISPFIKGHRINIGRKTSDYQKKVAGEKLKETRKHQIFPMKDTQIEVKIQEFLSQLHLEYYTHKYISEISHSYQCDILIPKQETEGVIILQKTIIECDGCFYHCCPICKFKSFKWTEKRKELDKIRTQELIDHGYKIIRLWEHEIKLMELNDLKEILS